ncbi:MAG: alanine dehydrogenase [Deltaproteobacteria bacterium]|nr:alanine dehydrogenase [Deltaproteobacteria bacterium]MBW2053163.1 alanine dehydrogenase [Deltaproteobacteria bacterium]MBW2142139.1 alanine dehydrogenase [Deltaproteobacteria bacterium]MBW2324626.1 alanine dehydrogenase [Deltaproteobacteria bacterium]
MLVGAPKEIKNNEFRVGMVPAGVRVLTHAGHQVFVQEGAGQGCGIADEEYIKAGAGLLATAEEVYERAEMIVKVKEPLSQEYPLIKEGQVLFTYLHLAPDPELTKILINCKCIGVAYETIQVGDGSLPLLTPMSEVAGRLAPQVGAHYLEKVQGGRGVLLGGVPGVEKGKVTVIGGGVVGTNAAKIAVGLGAEVYVLDINPRRLAALDDIFGSSITTIMANQENIARLVSVSDLVIGAVLIPGAKAPALITREMISSMPPGSVVVDVAIDQGGCVETSRPTTHQDPVFVIDGVIHYCVTNMPGAVARTSTFALTNVTLPYVLEIANNGLEKAVKENRALSLGVNLYKGEVTYPAVAEPMDCACEDILKLIA